MIKHKFSKIVLAILLASCSVTAVSAASSRSASVTTSVATSISTPTQALEQETYTLGVNAYLWGSTLVRMENIARLYTDVSNPQPDTSYRGPLNQFGHARRLSSSDDTDMPTANRDTLYSSAVLDLSQEPLVLSVPAVDDRYYVINMFDMWHNLFKYVGTRETGTLAKQFLIVPPGWQGSDIPHDLTVVESPTSKVWLWGRTQVFGEEDYATVHNIQDNYTLTPLSQYMGQAPKSSEVNSLPEVAGDKSDPLRFFVELGEYLKANPLDARQQALAGQFEKIGLTQQGFDRSKLSEPMQQMLVKALVDGRKIVDAQVANPNTLDMKDGWYYAFSLDNFGDDNALRSLIAGPYLGGQGAKEAIYPITYTDAKGAVLSGTTDYKMHFEQEPPVGAFWSVTVYDADSKLLVKNEINRFSISNLNKLNKAEDGSFDIYLSDQNPGEKQVSNWLPTPEGNFYVLARLYIPSKEILDMQWTVPAIQVNKGK